MLYSTRKKFVTNDVIPTYDERKASTPSGQASETSNETLSNGNETAEDAVRVGIRF